MSSNSRRTRWDDADHPSLSLTAALAAGADDPAPEPAEDATLAAYAEADARGPEPVPDWLVIDDGALDHDRGLVKTGKEADVRLVERVAPDGRRCLLAAKVYRSSEHRMFHRGAGYLEGRRVRRSREMRAMTTRTEFGRSLIAGRWVWAEMNALSMLWSGGLPVPYPVQLDGDRLLLEFLGGPDGTAAPRLAQLRPDRATLAALWSDLHYSLAQLAEAGYAHGDLSAYNLLVHHERVWLIDLPQIVDIVGNPQGPAFLARDVANVCTWFAARGLPIDPMTVTEELLALALGSAGPKPGSGSGNGGEPRR